MGQGLGKVGMVGVGLVDKVDKVDGVGMEGGEETIEAKAKSREKRKGQNKMEIMCDEEVEENMGDVEYEEEEEEVWEGEEIWEREKDEEELFIVRQVTEPIVSASQKS